MTQCQSLDDATTCANLNNANGDVSSCIESSCGYRLFPYIDVSIAGTSDPYDSDAATSTTSFVSIMSMFYGIVPYLMGFMYLVLFLASGNLVFVTRLVVLGVIAIVNEEIFKNLVKQHRPAGSCLYFSSFGMPSGHAATSIGLLNYLLLELFVYHPNILCGLTCLKRQLQTVYAFQWGYGWQEQNGDELHAAYNAEVPGGDEADLASESLSLRITTQKRESPRWLYHFYALCYFLLLFPVPFSRVYLHDHSRSQVLAGACIGIVASTVWYMGVVRTCLGRVIGCETSEWGKWWGLKFGGKVGFS